MQAEIIKTNSIIVVHEKVDRFMRRTADYVKVRKTEAVFYLNVIHMKLQILLDL